jgi:Ca2+-binding RTX toxin-like protein
MDGNDTVYAGDGNDTLYGGNGNDDLRGQVGNDSIEGGAGNDIVFGGAGVDTMAGGTGNDTCYVDMASDVVVELAGEGDDKVVASVDDWVLGAEFERLALEGSAVKGSGNAAANTLSGSAGANHLLGLGGNDTIFAGSGSDTLDGGDGADSLSGQDGNDTLIGGAGNDTLRGGNGADRFRFVTPAPGEGVDRIEDFSSAAGDKILVVAANFGLVAGAAATVVVNGLPTTGAGTFVYTSASGLLQFDADGNGIGAAVSLATLVTKPAMLAPADIVLGS